MCDNEDEGGPERQLADSRWGTCAYRNPRASAVAMWVDWLCAGEAEPEFDTVYHMRDAGVDAAMAELTEPRAWPLHPDDVEYAREAFDEAMATLLAMDDRFKGPYVTVGYMPVWLRESHRKAGNCGEYPHNGEVRVDVPAGALEGIDLDIEWASTHGTLHDDLRYDFAEDVPEEALAADGEER